MHVTSWRAIATASVALLAMPGLAAADHKLPKPMAPCSKICYEWKVCEIEETVYDVKPVEKVEKVSRPVIKEIKKPVSMKVCKPFSRTVLKEFCIPEYPRETSLNEKLIHHCVKDECGNCCETTEVVPQIVTCISKMMVPHLVPVIEWEMVAVEDIHYETYLVQEMQEVEVKTVSLVKVPRVIKRQEWKRVPVCAPKPEPCHRCHHAECICGG